MMKARVLDAVLAAHTLQIALPALAVRRIRKHEIELARRKRIIRQCRMRRSSDDVVRGLAFALQQQIGFADRVRFRIDILSIEVRRDFLTVLPRELLQGLLTDG